MNIKEFSVILTLVDREIRLFIRTKRYILSILQPLFYMTIMGFGISATVSLRGFAGTYLQFMGPGIVAMTVISTAMLQGISVLWDKSFGFMKEIMVAPVSRMSIMLGKSLGGAVIATFNGIAVIIIAMSLGIVAIGINIIPFILLMFLVSVAFSMMGIAIASVLEDMRTFNLLMNIIFMPMVFLSGIFYPVSHAPLFLQMASYIDPLTYPVDLLRGVITGYYSINPIIDAIVLSAEFIVLTFLGTWLFRRAKVQI